MADLLVNSPGSFDRVLLVYVDVAFRVELYVVVEPFGEVWRGAILARHQDFDLSGHRAQTDRTEHASSESHKKVKRHKGI